MTKITFSLIVFLLSFTICFSQTKLQRSKMQLNNGATGNSTTASSSKKSSSYNNSNNDGLGFIGDIVAGIAYYTVGFVMIGNYRGESHLSNEVSPYPFFRANTGNYYNPDTVHVNKNLVRLDVEDCLMIENNSIYANHFRAKLYPSAYFNITADYHQFLEVEPNTKNTTSLSVFNASFWYDRIRTKNFNLGWGIGVNYISNNINKAGITFGLNTDIFFARNINLYSGAKWSSVNSQSLNNLELGLKYHKEKYFFSFGYENLKIGTPKYNFVTFGGGITL
ncbi:hypothetical protein [Flavobacterium marginilacus]|uniref:hypothetical protein n=1 Tax=Flavobacterium marginilacus TaxID=3003256 RepID=UPI00248E7A60|nr:hypothetical protein [Flavobacterium marginilacus]